MNVKNAFDVELHCLGALNNLFDVSQQPNMIGTGVSKENKNKLKTEVKELKKLLKEAKRPANRLFLQEQLMEVEEMLKVRVGSSKSYGIANFF